MMSSNSRDLATLVVPVVATLVLRPLLTIGKAFGGTMGSGGISGSGTFGRYGGYGVSQIWSIVDLLVWLVVLVDSGYVVYRLRTRRNVVRGGLALEELRLKYAHANVSDKVFRQRRVTFQVD